MKINRERLIDYLDGLLAIGKRDPLVIGMILDDGGNEDYLYDELKCFGYRLEKFNISEAKLQIRRLENAILGGLKVALEFEDNGLELFMESWKRFLDN